MKKWLYAAMLLGVLGARAQEENNTALRREVTLPDGSRVEIETASQVKVFPAPAPEKPHGRKTAIVVNNLAGPKYDAEVLRFENGISARLAGAKFEIISRENVTKALKVYDGAGGNRNALGTETDQKLTDDTSALRLAQNMGADYLLVAAIDAVNKEARSYKDATAGVDVTTMIHTLRGTYTFLDGMDGAAIAGGPLKASRVIREGGNLTVTDDGILSGLIEKAADDTAKALIAKADVIRQSEAEGEVSIEVVCNARDLQGNEISLPNLIVTEDNKIQKDGDALALQVVANVALDGVVMGATPATLRVKPGLHTMRLTRPGFEDAMMTVKVTDGARFVVTMQMSDAGFTRWQQIRAVLNTLDTERAMTDAETELIRGAAQQLRQSGYRVDYKVDTQDAPTQIINKRSIYSMDEAIQ